MSIQNFKTENIASQSLYFEEGQAYVEQYESFENIPHLPLEPHLPQVQALVPVDEIMSPLVNFEAPSIEIHKE